MSATNTGISQNGKSGGDALAGAGAGAGAAGGGGAGFGEAAVWNADPLGHRDRGRRWGRGGGPGAGGFAGASAGDVSDQTAIGSITVNS